MRKSRNFIFLIISIGLASCKAIYRPNLAQVPVFKEKNNLQTDILVGSSGGELQLGYSISNNWALVGSAVYDVSSATQRDTLYGIKSESSNYANYSGELGIDYYHWLKNDSVYCLSLIVGGGYGVTSGYSDIWYAPDFVSYTANYYKIFWQPTFTVSGKYADLSFASRFRFQSYTTLTNKRGDSFVTGVDQYLEPVVSLKIGGEQFKFHLQAGTSIPFQNQSDYTVAKFFFAAGFHLNIKKSPRDDFYID